MRIERSDAGMLGEAPDRATDPFIEIEHHDLGWTEVEDLAVLEQRHANADSIPIADEGELLAVGPASNLLALHHHVARLHVNLIDVTQRSGPVLHDIGDSVDRILQVDFSHVHPSMSQTKRRNKLLTLGKA